MNQIFTCRVLFLVIGWLGVILLSSVNATTLKCDNGVFCSMTPVWDTTFVANQVKDEMIATTTPVKEIMKCQWFSCVRIAKEGGGEFIPAHYTELINALIIHLNRMGLQSNRWCETREDGVFISFWQQEGSTSC